MAKKKKDDSLYQVITGLGVMIGFYLWYKYSEANIYGLLAVIVLPMIVASIITRMIPSKQTKKKAPAKKKNTTSKTASKSTKQPSTTSEVPHNRLLPDEQILQLELQDMSWREIEQLVYLFYTAKGYKPELTKAGADGGIDLIYQNPEHGKTAVQIKQYIRSERQIDVKLIRELDAAKKNYKCVFSEFITTTTFTNPASAEKPPGMDLKDIRWFNRQVLPWMEKEQKKRKLA